MLNNATEINILPTLYLPAISALIWELLGLIEKLMHLSVTSVALGDKCCSKPCNWKQSITGSPWHPVNSVTSKLPPLLQHLRSWNSVYVFILHRCVSITLLCSSYRSYRTRGWYYCVHSCVWACHHHVSGPCLFLLLSLLHWQFVWQTCNHRSHRQPL